MMLMLKILAGILIFVVTAVIGAYLWVRITVARPMRFLKVEYTGKILTDQVSDGKETTGYDLYLPSQKKDSYGLVLYIHGGSFTSGDKSEGTKWCRFYAAHGYIAATMNYTVKSKGRDSSLHLMNEEIFSTVSAIKAQCEDLGYSIHNMATTGGSAGGCLAMLYAYSHKHDSPIPVKCVFQQTGPVIFEPGEWGQEGSEAQAAFAAALTGKTITAAMIEDGSYRPYLDAISPARLVTPDSVPTLCAYGPNDHIVPATLKFNLFEAFDANGVTYEYIEFTHSNHGMYSDLDKQQEYIEKCLAYCQRYLS